MNRLVWAALASLLTSACASNGATRERAGMPTRITVLSGTAREQLDTDEYSYLLLAGDDGERWVVVARQSDLRGKRVSVRDAVLVPSFKSASLGRTFDRVFFAVIDGPEAPQHATGAHPPPRVLSGTVQEILRAPPYMYLRLLTEGGELWAAVPAASMTEGARVAIASPANMDGFESTSLKRRFERIVFGTLAPVAASLPVTATASGPATQTSVDALLSEPPVNGARVRVRARVVKRTPQVLGKNWFHVASADGDAKGKTLVVVTLSDDAAVGALVDVEGVVRTEVDLGFGYRYERLIDEARIEVIR